jgi:hypothetical protein
VAILCGVRKKLVMGIYTVRDDKKIDEVISKDLEFIVHRVRKEIPVHAIVLGGGFGRGEGSVLYNGGEIRPVNDYDIFLAVSDNDHADLKRLSHEMAKQVGIRSIDLITINYCDLGRLPATQFHYDLKYGGTLLWGENILDQIPQFRKGCIDRRSGETLLLNRLVCALEAFSERFVYNGMDKEEKFFLVNQTGKVISACVEALLIERGKYHHSYSERRNIFDAEFPNWGILRRLNSQATDFKLMPSESPNIDAIAYWDETVSEYIKVLFIYFAPRSFHSSLGLLGRLAFDRLSPISKNPIETVELMLLLSRQTNSVARCFILSQVRRRLERISKRSFPSHDWEPLRAGAVQLWHQLCH